MVEDIVGCKWSLHILDQVRRGVVRPGAIARSHPQLTVKVMNQRLTKMVRFDILEHIAFHEVPPRVEYRFTSFGRRFMRILAAIEALQQEVTAAHEPEPSGARR